MLVLSCYQVAPLITGRREGQLGALTSTDLGLTTTEVEQIEHFDSESFSCIIYDPPTFSLAGELYSTAFYRQAGRVLRRSGSMFHYIGDPESQRGARVTRGVVRRLRFRGRMDTLHAAFLIAIAGARRFQLPDLAAGLSTLAAYCREITSAEYNNRPVAPLQVAGVGEDQIHEISHWPDKHLGLQHIVPGPDDHEILLWLNWVRTQTRETEIEALADFPGPDPGGPSSRPDLAHALNRLSSAVYYLELLFKAGKLTWRLPG